MANSIVDIPDPLNEPVHSYAPDSSERESLKSRLQQLLSETIEIAAIIGGREVRGEEGERNIVCPHDHGHVLGTCHGSGGKEVEQAIAAARDAWHDWSEMDWQARAAIFLKAADLLAGPWRDTVNAATMLGQSKTVYQAEIDSAAELIDFWRFNPYYMAQIYREQPP